MKKIGKLSINPDKVIKNEELVNLKGGYDGCYKCCWDWNPGVCSECYHNYASATCSADAHLIECGSSEKCYYYGYV